jgi:glycosyltransferase involved in cell wall biosynthesis
MKILITGTTGESMPPPYGGIPKLSLLNARVWKKLGHQVAITFTYCPASYDDFGVNAEYFFEYDCNKKPDKFRKIIFLIRYFFTNPFLYIDLLVKYFKIDPHFSRYREIFLYTAYGVFLDGVFDKFKPDAVMGEAALIKTFMAAHIARRHKVPIIFDTFAEIHDLSMGANKHLDENGRKKYWEAFLDTADFVIGDGNCAEGALAYAKAAKVKVFYDSCDYNFYKMEIKESKAELRKYFNLPEKTFLIGAVGAFSKRKGHDYLIKAVSKLVKKGYDVGALICGGAGDSGMWKTLAEEEGIKDRVFLFDNIKGSTVDLVKLYKCLDLYTNLSNTPRSCSWDMALLEAMATGLPIVVFRHGDLPEAVPGGTNGIVVPVNDVDATAEAFIKMHNLSPEEREKMGRSSSVFAAKTDINLTAGIKLDWLKDAIKNYKK